MRYFSIIVLAFLLTACGSDSEPVYDVQYYMDNPDIRKETVEKCNNNPGELSNTPNCINAALAYRRSGYK